MLIISISVCWYLPGSFTTFILCVLLGAKNDTSNIHYIWYYTVRHILGLRVGSKIFSKIFLVPTCISKCVSTAKASTSDWNTQIPNYIYCLFYLKTVILEFPFGMQPSIWRTTVISFYLPLWYQSNMENWPSLWTFLMEYF